MAAQFENITTSAVLTLPGVSVDGDDPTKVYQEKSGDIVQTRAGQTISARTWTQKKRLTVVFPRIDHTELANLRAYWRLRVFNLLPTGDPGLSYEMRWMGDFSPKQIGSGDESVENPSYFSLEAELEETI